MLRNVVKVVGISSLLAVNAYGVQVYKDDSNTLDILGSLRIYTGGHIDNIEAPTTFFGGNDLSSRIGLKFTNLDLPGIRATAYLELKVRSQSRMDGENFFGNRYAYIQLENDRYGSVKIGKVQSVIYDIIDNTTDRSMIGVNPLDGGILRATGLEEGSDDGIDKVRNAISIAKNFGGLRVAVQYQGRENNRIIKVGDLSNQTYGYSVSTIGQVADSSLVSQPIATESRSNLLLTRNFGAGIGVRYNTSNAVVGAAYQRVENTATLRADNGNKTDPSVPSSVRNTDIYLVGGSVDLGDYTVAASGGIFQNLHVTGITYMSATLFAEYRMGKIAPYIGYQLLYAPNPNKHFPISRGGRANYVMEDNYATIGIAYKPTSTLTFAVEHAQDLRSSKLRNTAILYPTKQNTTNLLVRYNFS
ncbi:Porin [Candidatus Hepatincolaceae symbiont of Richtersius coronifer]